MQMLDPKAVTMRLKILLAGLCALGAMMFHTGASAQTKLDMAIFHIERDPYAETLRWWIAEVQKRTGDKVQIRAHYSGSLAKLTEAFDAVRNGVVPMGLVAPSFISGVMPAMAYLEMLGGFPSTQEGTEKALPAMRPLMEKMFAGQGMVYLWQQPAFSVGVACRDKIMKAPADWKGVKVRTAGRWQAEQMKALGAIPVAIDPSEQYLALQSRAVDCALGIPTLLLGLKLNEVAPKITHLRMSVNAMLYVVNAKTWAGLSPSEREAISAVSLEAEKRSVPFLLGSMDDYYGRLKTAKAEVQSISDADLKAYRDAFRPVFESIGKTSDDTGRSLGDQLRKYW
ncbi:MAG: TRAP transporter substrate-binding protein DctP [Betaproteobacteria bacterium]|nr:TRAP transporter substrate-binding protein DctP [Betaproteobacteria bacterium]